MRSRISAKKIEEFAIALTIFISSIVFFKQPFEGYIHYIIFLIYLPFFISRYGAPGPILKLIAIPALTSLAYVALGENSFFNFFKIFMGLLLSCSFYYYVFRHYDFNIIKLFRLYLRGGMICCYIGIIQGISYLIKFSPGYDFRWLFNKWGIIPGGLLGIRVNSIFPEPSQFAIMISPLIFISVYNLLTRRYRLLSRNNSLLVLFTLVISTSSTGYLGLLFTALILTINFRRIIDMLVIILVSSVGIYFLYQNVEDFRLRVDSYTNIISNDELTIDDINSSSFVQYNNSQVAFTNFWSNPLFGTGFGSHQVAYEKYSLTKQSDFAIKSGFDFNSQDANSLFLRVVSEMGLLGIVFLILIVIRGFVIKPLYSSFRVNWIISGSILILILLTYLRQGNYFLNGFPFFIMLYYYNWIDNKKHRLLLDEQ